MTDCTFRDPNHNYTLAELLRQTAPPAPDDFHDVWRAAYQQTIKHKPIVRVESSHQSSDKWSVSLLSFISTDGITIRGWLLTPRHNAPSYGLIIGHGYGGRDSPDFHLPFDDAVLFFPCARGISLSHAPPISHEPQWHVLHDIDKPRSYIMRGCVEDTWLAVSCLEQLFPYLRTRLGYLGVSFSGGVGAIAMAYEKRISRAHFDVPTFGDHRARLRAATYGSGHAIQQFYRRHKKMTLKTLRYFDAANAAESMSMPVHFALALKDPVVTPLGQFAIYNAVSAQKTLFILNEGHGYYPEREAQERKLLIELNQFFSPLRQ